MRHKSLNFIKRFLISCVVIGLVWFGLVGWLSCDNAQSVAKVNQLGQLTVNLNYSDWLAIARFRLVKVFFDRADRWQTLGSDCRAVSSKFVGDGSCHNFLSFVGWLVGCWLFGNWKPIDSSLFISCENLTALEFASPIFHEWKDWCPLAVDFGKMLLFLEYNRSIDFEAIWIGKEFHWFGWLVGSVASCNWTHTRRGFWECKQNSHVFCIFLSSPYPTKDLIDRINPKWEF